MFLLNEAPKLQSLMISKAIIPDVFMLNSDDHYTSMTPSHTPGQCKNISIQTRFSIQYRASTAIAFYYKNLMTFKYQYAQHCFSFILKCHKEGSILELYVSTSRHGQNSHFLKIPIKFIFFYKTCSRQTLFTARSFHLKPRILLIKRSYNVFYTATDTGGSNRFQPANH